MTKLDVNKRILSKNEELAEALKEGFDRDRTLVLNFVSSPGSGKTTLLSKILVEIQREYSVGVIEGDLQTDFDAERIRAAGIPAVQVNTNGSCHLEALDIEKAMVAFGKLDLLIIENVGNLVCPSSYELGEDAKVCMLSVTEGEDKPAKYPSMFHVSSAFIINKTDLLPYVDFDVQKCRDFALGVNPTLDIFETSCKTGHGLDEFIGWIKAKIRRKKGE
ncbi:MAG: hydrogenase nickel incorporation protein HypB [Geovibrio sp.]|jgi:hydrogenase nickel incorporation protein HypB|uniref:hydrogenase nickel incorporation protein HypB n=1 Tax=Geovibrio ferrireducens TaxID=46201 RepID=UPI00224528B1|nr:hydrogenase nickel incorporation protein HypB [Geovibrio ferrireducens]MCD8491427.1 hydrogenase nickel incorporation protein HypB [Geovibrio sp.]MCD8568331.1 hydrogenase nickel incorporation protein HypB [Geovibrio sp.]